MASSLKVIVGPNTHERTYTGSDTEVGDVIKDSMRQVPEAVEQAMVAAGMIPPLDFDDKAQVAEAFVAWLTWNTKRLARGWRKNKAEADAVFVDPEL